MKALQTAMSFPHQTYCYLEMRWKTFQQNCSYSETLIKCTISSTRLQHSMTAVTQLIIVCNIEQNTGPCVLNLLSYLLVVMSHATADLGQVYSHHLVNKVLHWCKVYYVRPLVEVGKQQPITNCILVQIIVRIRDSGVESCDGRLWRWLHCISTPCTLTHDLQCFPRQYTITFCEFTNITAVIIFIDVRTLQHCDKKTTG